MDDAERTLLIRQCERRILINSNNFAKLHRKVKRAESALAAAEARADEIARLQRIIANGG